MTDYETDYLLGAYYGRPSSDPAGWSWEAGLDYASPKTEDGTERVRLVLVRADLSTSLHSWVGAGVSLYLHWGGQSSIRVSPGSDSDFMLTAGMGLRHAESGWDLRFTGQSTLGEANVDQFWVLTAGYLF
jgi:hypothetical protein